MSETQTKPRVLYSPESCRQIAAQYVKASNQNIAKGMKWPGVVTLISFQELLKHHAKKKKMVITAADIDATWDAIEAHMEVKMRGGEPVEYRLKERQ